MSSIPPLVAMCRALEKESTPDDFAALIENCVTAQERGCTHAIHMRATLNPELDLMRRTYQNRVIFIECYPGDSEPPLNVLAVASLIFQETLLVSNLGVDATLQVRTQVYPVK